jgi:hypothetical protein
MRLSHLTVLACVLCVAGTAAGQSEPWTSPPMLKGPCPEAVDSKTAWFDPDLYLLHQNGVTIPRASSPRQSIDTAIIPPARSPRAFTISPQAIKIAMRLSNEPGTPCAQPDWSPLRPSSSP